MEMVYKEQGEEARSRWTAYWQGEIVDRPIMLITVPRDNPVPLPEPSDDRTQ